MNEPPVEQSVKMTIKQVVEYLNEGIRDTENLLVLTRSSKLQLKQCLTLDMYLYNVRRIKQESVLLGKEDEANLFLGFECAFGAMRSELMMWIQIKQDLPNEAWDCLVAAQMGCMDATRAHQGFAKCEQRLEKLKLLEEQLFSPQSFMSVGFISDGLDCSICGERYSRCEHLRGKPYMGKFCEINHRNPRGDHAALVKVPADKRCRIVSFKTKDGHRDKLSWEITPYTDNEAFTDDGALEANSILMALERYPYLSPTEKVLGLQFLRENLNSEV